MSHFIVTAVAVAVVVVAVAVVAAVAAVAAVATVVVVKNLENLYFCFQILPTRLVELIPFSYYYVSGFYGNIRHFRKV